MITKLSRWFVKGVGALGEDRVHIAICLHLNHLEVRVASERALDIDRQIAHGLAFHCNEVVQVDLERERVQLRAHSCNVDDAVRQLERTLGNRSLVRHLREHNRANRVAEGRLGKAWMYDLFEMVPGAHCVV
jgi:hypothetical protein